MVCVLLWQLFKDDLTKVIESQLKIIHWCLLIEKGICLTWNVWIWSKLVILLNPKKAYTFFQQWAGKVINCISSNNYISLVCTKINIFYFILGCKLILILFLDLGVLCDQCCQMNLIEIFTSTQIEDNDFVYIICEFDWFPIFTWARMGILIACHYH